MHNTLIRGVIYLLPLLSSLQAQAGEADVVEVKAGCEASCTFYVTVRHADESWDHYADRWEILTIDGTLIATRVLHHPHENEQPFTRSLNNVNIPAGVSQVVVRAHDSIHGLGGKQVTVKIREQD